MSDLLTPIDQWLAEQQGGTAVERFARRHDDGALDRAVEVRSGRRTYADRLPVGGPGPGEQYAFRVDLDSCSGCKSCVAACHSLNGLDAGESWRSVGELIGTGDDGRHQTVPSGCHHCVDPACLSGCPTNAYEKDPWTGIVRHLDDQCFGCGYCELACPYEVPTMNRRLGVVRKCDLCADRLAEGEAPACVQACPTGAIAIDVVDVAATVASTATGSLVPGAPASSITHPTTVYVSAEPLPGSLVAADHHAVRPSTAHPPLAFMLVATQLSVGAWLTAVVVALATGSALPAPVTVAAAITGVAAMIGSVTHLGRPGVAWRAVLGVGHSWLSREIVAFGTYVGLVSVAAMAVDRVVVSPPLQAVLVGATTIAGLAGVICSALLYAVTRRAFWRSRLAIPKFFATVGATGPAVAAAALLAAPVEALGTGPVVAALAVAAAVSMAKLTAEAMFLRGSTDPDLARTIGLLTGPLADLTRWRFGCGLVGATLLAVAGASVRAGDTASGGALTTAGLVLVLAGEGIERWQFFVAAVAPRMPGGLRR